jgi:hypothetical protein
MLAVSCYLVRRRTRWRCDGWHSFDRMCLANQQFKHQAKRGISRTTAMLVCHACHASAECPTVVIIPAQGSVSRQSEELPASCSGCDLIQQFATLQLYSGVPDLSFCFYCLYRAHNFISTAGCQGYMSCRAGSAVNTLANGGRACTGSSNVKLCFRFSTQSPHRLFNVRLFATPTFQDQQHCFMLASHVLHGTAGHMSVGYGKHCPLPLQSSAPQHWKSFSQPSNCGQGCRVSQTENEAT